MFTLEPSYMLGAIIIILLAHGYWRENHRDRVGIIHGKIYLVVYPINKPVKSAVRALPALYTALYLNYPEKFPNRISARMIVNIINDRNFIRGGVELNSDLTDSAPVDKLYLMLSPSINHGKLGNPLTQSYDYRLVLQFQSELRKLAFKDKGLKVWTI